MTTPTSTPTATSDDLLSADDVARTLGVTKQTVSRLIRTGALPAEKVGNKWVIFADKLGAYLVANNLVPEPADHPRRPGITPTPAGAPADAAPSLASDTSPAGNAIPAAPIRALSFFSGALGLDLGMERAGIHPALYCENDRKCRMTIHSMRPDAALIGDINRYEAAQILEMAGLAPGTVDVMFGGPPCQAFSTAGARRAFDDDRGNVFLRYLALAAEIQPTYVVVENVRGLLSTPFPLVEGGQPERGGAFQLVLRRLAEAGYEVSFNLYNAANFGAPQIRERVVLIGKRGGGRVPYLTPTHAPAGECGLPPWRTFRDAVDDLDTAGMHHTDFPEKRLRYFRMLKEGECWKNLPDDMQREAMGKAYALSGGKTGFYRRIRFDRPCPTLVTTPTMPATDLCHPTEDRPLSIEEYKRVQGFPDDWRICGDLMDVYKQIGNAVPVALGEAIGRALRADMTGEAADPRFEGFPYSRYKRTSDQTWG